MEREARKRLPSSPQNEHSEKIFRNTLRGQNAWERHQEYVSRYLNVYGDGGKALKARLEANSRNDWDVLKEKHRFLREDEQSNPSTTLTAGASSAYEDEVAKRYYNHLFKEYAIADMKHYKTGNVALRWRSEEDVIDGIGQFTCASNRCEYHRQADKGVDLTPYEMTFVYEEADDTKNAAQVRKSALVKVVLCSRCTRKLKYKSDKDRQERQGTSRSRSQSSRSSTQRLL